MMSMNSPVEENLWEDLNTKMIFTGQMQLVLYLNFWFFFLVAVFYLGRFLCHNGSGSQPSPLFSLAIPCAS